MSGWVFSKSVCPALAFRLRLPSAFITDPPLLLPERKTLCPRSVSTLVPGCYNCRLRYSSLYLHRRVTLKIVHASRAVALPTLDGESVQNLRSRIRHRKLGVPPTAKMHYRYVYFVYRTSATTWRSTHRISKLCFTRGCMVASTLSSYRRRAQRTLTVNLAMVYAAVDVGPVVENLHKNCVLSFRICHPSAAGCYAGYDSLKYLTADSEAAGPPTSTKLLWNESLATPNGLYGSSERCDFLNVYMLSCFQTRECSRRWSCFLSACCAAQPCV